MSLTDRQQEVYEYLQDYFVEHHHIPPLAEVRDHFGFASLNAAHTHMRALRKKGYIKNSSYKNWSFTKLEVGIIPIE